MRDVKQTISLKFDGRIAPESVDIKSIIATLHAYQRISEKAARTLYGDSIKSSLRLTHVRPGSIDIGGFVEIANHAQQALPIFASATLGLKDIAELIKAWLDILKFLKGEQPRKIEPGPSQNKINVTNNGGQTNTFNGNVYNNCIFNNIGKDAEKLTPPFNAGANTLRLISDAGIISSYSAADAEGFREIRALSSPIESEIDAILSVRTAVLEGDGQWRFKYGSQPLSANMGDQEFLKRVHNGEESFRKGDRFLVRLKSIQQTSGSKRAVRHEITHVVRRAD